MSVKIIYKLESDHAREVLDYLRDFSRQTGREIEEIDPETREGADFCRVYDIVEYPSIVAIGENGSLVSLWRGRPLPTINEVSFYA
ncbi:hypothetical protein FJZ39_01650 [Candidatus Saccharibacteria bacterium]|nr:hypothetical protein [Candidatus Saccharibacteria bacterium]